MLNWFRHVYLRIKQPRWPAAACAVLLLFALPLAFRDGFFDINRFKVNIVLCTVPAAAGWMLFSLALQARHARDGRIHRSVTLAFTMLAVFLLVCVLSSAMQGFSRETLYGTDGRFCGLVFLLCCGLAFCTIALGALDGVRIASLAVFSAVLVSALGILNSAGIDPLHFYDRIRRTQISVFLSTIGNVDFFGAYLAMIYPIAASFAAYAKSRKRAIGFGAAASIIACGASVSRSDSAFFALQLASLALFALSGEDYKAMCRAMMLWAAAWAALPLMRSVLQNGLWEIDYTGIFKVLCDTGAAWALCAVCLLGAAACAHARKRDCAPPGSGLLLRWCGMLFVLLLAALIGLIAYFTAVNPDAELGEIQNVLRFSDEWGTRRGFVYLRAIRAYSDFSLPEKLLGGGVDCTARILAPYFDNTVMLKYGTFNDAHCQLLQFLLTTGLLGAASYAAFYLVMLRACLVAAKGDPLLGGCAVSLCGYIAPAMLGVTQPIIVITYFSICALAASRMNHFATGREIHES